MADKKLQSTHKSMLAGAGGALIAIMLVLGSVGVVKAMHGPDSGERHGGRPDMMMQGGPRLGGEITKIDGNTITVTGRDDQAITVKVDDSTKYKKDNGEVKLSDLKVGDEIMIRGDVQSVTVNAESIGIRN